MNINVSKPRFGTDGWRGIIGEDFNSFNCLLVVTSLLKLSPVSYTHLTLPTSDLV